MSNPKVTVEFDDTWVLAHVIVALSRHIKQERTKARKRKTTRASCDAMAIASLIETEQRLNAAFDNLKAQEAQVVQLRLAEVSTHFWSAPTDTPICEQGREGDKVTTAPRRVTCKACLAWLRDHNLFAAEDTKP